MLAHIFPVNPGRPDNSLPEGQPGVNPPLFPTNPIYIGGIGWVTKPEFPTPPIHIPPIPPSIWNPAFPSQPIYIPGGGWVNVPTFPNLPIVIPPPLPPGINIPNFPTNPIVIPPMPVSIIPEGKVLVLVATNDGSKWGLVDQAKVEPPIALTPAPK